MFPTNDKKCFWINNLTPRSNIKSLKNNITCDWLIVGAGYTGLSAARKLAHLYPNKKIVLVDAQLAGEGASAEFGYLVDTTLMMAFNKELENYGVNDIYSLGINTVKKFIQEFQVDCE